MFGVAYEHTTTGVRPLAGLPLRLEGTREGGLYVTVEVVTDAAGRYEVPGILREYLLVGTVPQEAYLSPCSVRLWLWNDDPKNVHVVSRTSLLATGIPRSMLPLGNLYPGVAALAGFVTEKTPDGARPVVGASVEHLYGDGRSGDSTGFTLTDVSGHFVLCGYNDDYGQAVRVSKDGYRTEVRSLWLSSMNFELVRQ